MYQPSLYQMVPFTYTYPDPNPDPDPVIITSMAGSIDAVENLLNYRFKNWKLLEDALTHPSYSEAESYQRLEFLGDAALGMAVSSYVFREYPDLDPGQLSLLRSANISTEKLARVAVKHRLYMYVRHNAIGLDQKVSDFLKVVAKEDETVVYGGAMKAPKVLADITESVAAAVYVDCGYDLKALWLVFRDLLEPIVTLEMLNQQPQPVTTLFEVCQKDGLQVNFKHQRKGEKNIASVYVDGQLIASGSSGQKANAKLHAAEAALETFSQSGTNDDMSVERYNGVDGTHEIKGAKQKLHELCGRKRWPNPIYNVEKEVGRAHERKYICSVRIDTVDKYLVSTGDEMSKMRDAESSAALMMIYALQENKY